MTYPAIITLSLIVCCQSLVAQNVYPASGDALIHRLTIGTGRLGLSSNTALGDSALFSNLKGGDLTAVGLGTLSKNTTGTENAAMGYQALYNTTSGTGNVAAGSGASYSYQRGGGGNVALGQMALYSSDSTFGQWDAAVGAYALFFNTLGYENVAFGYRGLYNNSGANYNNTGFGASSLLTNTTGSSNTAVGAGADVTFPNLSTATAIGYNAVVTASNSIVIGNSSVTSIGGYANFTTLSDGRFKKNVTRNVPGLSFINLLDPVTYTLDIEGIEARLHPNRAINEPGDRPLTDPVMQQTRTAGSRIVHTGFIAQDVERAAQSRGYHFSGVDKPKNDRQPFYGLRYSEFVAPLVKAVQELSAQNDSLKAANDRLQARLDRIKQLLAPNSNARK